MGEFRMPSLGADMTEGTLVEWSRKPGDAVERGDLVAVIATEKADFEVEVYEDGVLDKLLVEPGETVPVGTVLATIRSEGEPETAPAGAPAAGRAAAATVSSPSVPSSPPAPAAAAQAQPERRVHASPLARRLARELGVDLAKIRPVSRDGVIHRSDVEQAAAQKKAAAKPEAPTPSAPAEKKPVAPAGKAVSSATKARSYQGMRQSIAAAMSRSNAEIPHYHLETHISLQRMLSWLTEENLRRALRDRILPVVPLVKAVAQALGDVPELNGYWIDGEHRIQEAIHIGFAISLKQGGLIAPAIFDVDLKSLDELMAAVRDLITRTRAGRLRGREMSDPTITVTNLGDMGVETVHGVIYPPQVALVGFGRITDRPWAENGMLGVHPVVSATLAADHRATDGHRGAQFLDALNRYLQEPDKL